MLWVHQRSTRKRTENINERSTGDLVAAQDLGNEKADATIRQKIQSVFEKGERERGIVTQATFTIIHRHTSPRNRASKMNQVGSQAFLIHTG